MVDAVAGAGAAPPWPVWAVANFVHSGEEASFFTVMSRAHKLGEVAIGFTSPGDGELPPRGSRTHCDII
jgi:hypothetical protein